LLYIAVIAKLEALSSIDTALCQFYPSAILIGSAAFTARHVCTDMYEYIRRATCFDTPTHIRPSSWNKEKPRESGLRSFISQSQTEDLLAVISLTLNEKDIEREGSITYL